LRNPQAGRGQGRARVEPLERALRDERLHVSVTGDREQLTEWVGEGGVSEIRAVVAAGGDGTVATLVNGLPKDMAVSVFPLGTENLMAKYLGLPLGPRALAHQIRHGATVRLDVGLANDRRFLLMAGVGFDAEVVARLHANRQGPIRHSTYVKPILDSLRTYKYPRLDVRVTAGRGAESHETAWSARWAFVVNVPRYAMGLRFAPGADSADGLLNLVTFEHGSWRNGLRYLWAVLDGRHTQLFDCRTAVASRIQITSELPAPYQVDGDPGGMLPLDLKLAAARVRVVVGEAWAVANGFRHAVSN